MMQDNASNTSASGNPISSNNLYLVGREIDDKQQREVVFRPKLRPGSLSFGSNALLPPRQNPSLTLP